MTGNNRLSNSDHNNRSPSLSPHHTPHGSDPDLLASTDEPTLPAPSGHRRSQSAELVDNPALLLDPRYSASLTEPLNLREARAHQFDQSSQEKTTLTDATDGISKSDKITASSSFRKQDNNNSLHQSPSRPASMSSLSAKKQSSASAKQTRNILPLNLAEAGKKASGKGTQRKSSDVFYF